MFCFIILGKIGVPTTIDLIFNLLEDENVKDMATKLKVAGQALEIIKAGTKIDLTGESFRYAKNEPEKLEALIKEKIDPLLK